MRLRSVATPATMALFAVMALTGTLMFFGYRQGFVHKLHETTSLVFVLAAALHLTVNWKALLAHLRTPWVAGLVILAALAVLLAMIPHAERNDPRKALTLAGQAVLRLTVKDAAALTRQRPETLKGKLLKDGLVIKDDHASLKAIALSNGKDPMAVLAIVMNGTDSPAPR